MLQNKILHPLIENIKHQENNLQQDLAWKIKLLKKTLH